MSLAYISPIQLVQHLRDPQDSGTVVIDVREEDYAVGKIRGSFNIPAATFHSEATLDAVVQNHCVPSTSRLVVHCLLSQVRGPRCASAIMKRLAAQGRAGQPPVLVLRGGWEEFHSQYGGEGDVVEPL